MRILVVSHTPHYLDAAGTVVGWGPTIRELDALADRFGPLTHVAPLHDEPAPASAIPYTSSRVAYCRVPPAGGTRIVDKACIIARIPVYARTIVRHMRTAELVHVRCPANISLVAICILALTRIPKARWVKYAGNWRPPEPGAASYRLQRWMLRRGWPRAVVTVNGRWSGQPAHIVPFDNPAFTRDELERARRAGSGKTITSPVRLLFVGRLEEAKGALRAIEVAALVRTGGVPARLDLVGDGVDGDRCRALADRLGISGSVVFHGWLPRDAVHPLYGVAHFLVLPSVSEGWPKVLGEAMAHGAVCLAGAVSAIPQVLTETGAGDAVAPADVGAFTGLVRDYVAEPERWRRTSRNGMDAAERFTYETYLEAVSNTIGARWPGSFGCAGDNTDGSVNSHAPTGTERGTEV